MTTLLHNWLNNWFLQDKLLLTSPSLSRVHESLYKHGEHIHNVLDQQIDKVLQLNSPWLYYSVYILPLVWLINAGLNSYFTVDNPWTLFSWSIMPISIFIVLPIIELWLRHERVNPSTDDYDRLQQDQRYNWVLWLWPMAQYLILIMGAYYTRYYTDISLNMILNLTLLIINTAIINGGIGINIAHELIHRNEYVDRMLGQFILISVMYPHFYIEHLFGHHKNIATYEDAGTARRNEPVYKYWWRSIRTGYINSWYISRRFHRPYIMYVYHIFIGLMFVYMYSINGLWAMLFYLSQSLASVFILETVQYIEHYGLVRRSGQEVSLMHCWNSDTVITNYLTFRLQRHSDHHKDSKRHYPNLRDFDNVPRLPTGYTGSMLLALIPSLWFRIMNPKLEKLHKRLY